MRMLPDHVYGFFLSVMLLLSAVNGNDCPESFKCGNLGDIRFPLTIAERQDCGALSIHGCGCDDNQHQPFQFIIIGRKRFQVSKIEHPPWWSWPIVYIFYKDLNKLLNSSSCEVFKHNITLPPTSPLGSFIIDKNITMFQCDRNLSVSTPKTFLKNTSCPKYDIFFSPPNSDDVSLGSLAECSTVQLPTNGLPISENPFSFLTAEIPISFIPSNECFQCFHGHLDERQKPQGRCFLDGQQQFYCARRYEPGLKPSVREREGEMAALHKFKLFASHCGVAQSPTQSPRASPLIQLRRPKTTLRTLLSLSCGSPRPQEAALLKEHVLEKKGKDLMRRHSLKDLFVSSPPREGINRATLSSSSSPSSVLGSVGVGVVNMGLNGPRSWAGGSNSVWRGFRCRSLLKRKAWRPLLLTIPEDDH